jgi:hypothetical protein
MAQLVHFNNYEEKYLKLKSEEPNFINRIISSNDRQKAKQFSSTFLSLAEERSRLIRDFFSWRELTMHNATVEAHKSSRRRLAIQIITLYYFWINNIKKEETAIDIIALKIAQKVLNKNNIIAPPTREGKMSNKILSDYFSLKLVLPLDFQCGPDFANYFSSLSFLTIEQHDKHALLKVLWQHEERTVALDDLDISWFMNRIIKEINRIKQELTREG